MVKESNFSTIDLGTPKPTSAPQETVQVVISTETLLGDFAKGFVNEAHRVAPLRAEQVNLTCEELTSYCAYLLTRRVNQVQGDCPEWRKLKVLYIPSFIQYTLSLVGEVRLRDRGLIFMPEMAEPSELSYEQALAISEKIGSFADDLQIVQDAMPRSIEGDKDVMTSALIAGYVRTINPVQHVVSTYITAFLGLKLREEMSFKVLYRVQYDDLAFIASALTKDKHLY